MIYAKQNNLGFANNSWECWHGQTLEFSTATSHHREVKAIPLTLPRHLMDSMQFQKVLGVFTEILLHGWAEPLITTWKKQVQGHMG